MVAGNKALMFSGHRKTILKPTQIWYVYPMWKNVSFRVIGDYHVELLKKYFKVEPVDEHAFPLIQVFGNPLVILHPFFYPLQAFEKKISASLGRFCGIIGIDVADSDHISNYAVSLTEYATAIIVPSNFARQAYISSGVKCPVHVIPHGVSTKFIEAKKQEPTAFRYLAELKEKRNIKLVQCWVVHSPTRKGLDILLQYYQALAREYDNVLLVIKTARGVGCIPKTVEYKGGDLENYMEWKVLKGWLSEGEVMELMDICLAGDANLLTPDGDIPIRDIQPGDCVLSINDEGQLVWDRVLGWSERELKTSLYEIETEDGLVLKLTGNHKVYTSKGWVEAKDLNDGTLLLLYNGKCEKDLQVLDGGRKQHIEGTLGEFVGSSDMGEVFPIPNLPFSRNACLENVGSATKSNGSMEETSQTRAYQRRNSLLSWNNRWRRDYRAFLLPSGEKPHHASINIGCKSKREINNLAQRKSFQGWLYSQDDTKEQSFSNTCSELPICKADFGTNFTLSDNKEGTSNNLIELYITERQQAFSRSLRQRRFGFSPKDGRVKWSKIRAIRKTETALQKVYDVKTTTSRYFANRILVHNCDLYFLSSRGGGFEHPPLLALARGEIVLAGKGGAWEDYLPKWALLPSRKSGKVFSDNPIHDGKGVEVIIDKAVDKTIEIFDNMDEYKARVQEYVNTRVKEEFTWEKIGSMLDGVIRKYV